MTIRKLGYCAALLAMAAAAALADAGDPPSRVARLNYKSGSVSFRPGSVEEWTEASLNYPLTIGDRLWTQPGARAELHTGSTAIRMASETALAILNLDDRTVQLSFTEGTIDVHILDLAFGESFEVDTPNAAISLLRPGDYRIDANSDTNLTTVTARDGEADVTAGGSTFSVRMRESARIAGLDQVTQETGPAPPPNEFDLWCATRARREAQSQSVRYVSRETIGYEDLDQYGTWRQVPPYGWVWMPGGVSANWAPYHEGHWAWVEPWGWTWIDDAPWGFAPFHYGRWAYAGGWYWIPGTLAPRPVYAPALVAFVGGPGFGVSAAFGVGGAVAWFPLGPGEVYRPGYRVSQTYVRQVNITHVSVTNIDVVNVRYVNRDVRGAVTAVPREAFVQARPVARAAVAMDAREIAQGQVVGAAPLVAPRRESVLANPEQRSMSGPPARFADRAVMVRTAPPPPPVSFGAKQQALEASQGRPLDAGALDNLRRSAPPANPMVRTMQVAPGSLRQPTPAATPRNTPNDRPPARTEQQPRSDRPAQAAPPNNPPARQASPARKTEKAPKAQKTPDKKVDK